MSSSPISSSSSSLAEAGGDFRNMHDVRCGVEFNIGTGALSVRQCLGLTLHSVVRLDQPAGADLDMVVHGVTVAHGEVVVVDDDSMLRISRIVVPPGAEAA
jgi:flagellar motor switch protein FliN